MANDSTDKAGPATVAGRFRAAMPIAKHVAYFDHAAVAPLPESTRNSIRQWLDQATEEGDVVWSQWAQRLEEVRQAAARMINAQPSEMALVPNTTSGISLVAEGFPWRPGDNVVTLANEFPSNQYPWMNQSAKGVEVRRVPVDGGAVDLDRLAAACDARTRILSVSWVGYATGWRIDIQEVAKLCRRAGCLFFLDAIQGLGVFPIDVRDCGVDFLAADGHKWLLGPEGAGLFFVRQEHLSLLRPLMVGWNSVVQGSDYTRIELNIRHEAARYEGGSQNMIGFVGLGASLDLLASLGVGPRSSPVAEQVLAITDYACERLLELGARLHAPRSGSHRSGIVTFELPGHDPNIIRRQLEAAKIIVRCRAGGVRISPHGYATTGEVDRLIDELQKIGSGS
ncbi:MAG TPA: aminotransferase class V-fold PLP-dependent enzyme [Pirellulaceae bacterium]|nr:aminotransferase class V-fold PLP-dependent enzyme [Pirellulaceae bacterium]